MFHNPTNKLFKEILKSIKIPVLLILLFAEQSVYPQEKKHTKNINSDSILCVKLDSLFTKYKFTDFEQSKEICFEAITLGKSLDNHYILEHWYRQLGDLYAAYEMNSSAANYYAKGLLYSQNRKNIDNRWYITIGNIYFADKRYPKAHEYYQKAYAHFSANKDQIEGIEGMAEALSNIAKIYQEHTMFDSALILSKKSLQLRKKNK
ncbi:MAG: tetratricopeptide repeat protein [Bacteroidales bacterium]|nr:tetratricopeptide repeat protein [Bacteroidales bacterium]